MRKAKKLQGTIVTAYRLGNNSPIEAALIKQGKIRILPNSKYEIFSREALSGTGELASSGDYFKLDSEGFPYPNERQFFLSNHRHIGGDQYEQTSMPMEAWTFDDGICSEIQFLIDHMGLVINEKDKDKFFTAPLWGTMESAKSDAVIVFYNITRAADGSITDAEFNFVERNEFRKTYIWVE